TIPLHSTDSTYAPIFGHSRSPLRFSAILDHRSSAATNAHIFFRPEAPPRTPPHTHINIHLDR
ncbi:hypothetical protein BDBG_17606, partial [Blastomyces gilchristii SLH14081]